MDHSSVTDSRLAELEALYRRRFRVFLRVATGILRDEERALDAVQDGFAAAIRERRRFRGDGPLEAWVWRIVVNSALKESARPIHEELADVADPGSTEDPTTVGEAIARLPERQRLTLFLRYYADLDYGSIAA